MSVITWMAIAVTSALVVYHGLNGNFLMSALNVVLGFLFCKVMGVL